MVGLNISLRFIFKPSYSPHCINSNVGSHYFRPNRQLRGICKLCGLEKDLIKKSHIIPQGKGETEPIPGHECLTIEKYKDDKEKYKEMHQRNRRTAFRVIKESDPNAPVLESK